MEMSNNVRWFLTLCCILSHGREKKTLYTSIHGIKCSLHNSKLYHSEVRQCFHLHRHCNILYRLACTRHLRVIVSCYWSVKFIMLVLWFNVSELQTSPRNQDVKKPNSTASLASRSNHGTPMSLNSHNSLFQVSRDQAVNATSIKIT